MAQGRILVVAPNPDLRRSLAFAFEAEGYVVTSYDSIPGREASRGYDCAVLDHRAVSGPREAVLAFCRATRPVLLLAATAQPWLIEAVFAVIETPLSGDTLMEAVRLAMSAAVPLRSSTK